MPKADTAIAQFMPQQAQQRDNPSTPSGAYQAMKSYWELVDAILGGAESMRKMRSKYLPKMPDETDENYKFRADHAKFTNIFADITQNLAQRPFAKEATFSDDTDARLLELAENIDGRGNDLNQFLGTTFHEGINFALDWILVDYHKGETGRRTRAQEREMGVRPYWVRYRADQVLEATTAMIRGEEEFVRVRLAETHVERDGFSEIVKHRVRLIERPAGPLGTYGAPQFTLYEKQKDRGGRDQWIVIAGPEPIDIPKIPLVPFLTGRRIGDGFQVRPPMRDAAELQVELFQQESALKHAETATGFPMLAGQGVSPPTNADGTPKAVKTGPLRILYAPMGADGNHGKWEWIEISAESLKFLQSQVKETKQDLRELGRQPLTAQTGNLTVVTTAFAAQKGNAAIQAWALNLVAAAQRAAYFTGLWLNEENIEATVLVDTDFDLGVGDEATYGDVLTLRERGEISRQATLIEAKRRGILRADFDPDEDAELLLDDIEDDPDPDPGDIDDEDDLDEIDQIEN